MKLTSVRVLRSPEPPDSAYVDPFAESAAGIDTTFPVLAPDRLLRFEVKSCEKKTNESGGVVKESIKFKLKLMQDTTFRDGKPARAGYVFTQNIGLTPSDKYDIEAIKRNLAVWLKAALGDKAATVTLREFLDNPSMLEGLPIDGTTGISKDKNGVFADSTMIRPMLPA